MNDILLKKLIQQSRAVQGYLSYTPNQLEQALEGWKVGLREIPQGDWEGALQAAMAVYESGPLNPPFVRKLYYKTRLPEIDETSAVAALKHLAMEVVTWAPSEHRQNILKPIADWVERRPKDVALKVWEKKVLDAVKPETENRSA